MKRARTEHTEGHEWSASLCAVVRTRERVVRHRHDAPWWRWRSAPLGTSGVRGRARADRAVGHERSAPLGTSGVRH
jgi:hypothetical protein